MFFIYFYYVLTSLHSWKEHCYAIIQQSCGDVARLLDEQFDSIRHLTYRTFSGYSHYYSHLLFIYSCYFVIVVLSVAII